MAHSLLLHHFILPGCTASTSSPQRSVWLSEFRAVSLEKYQTPCGLGKLVLREVSLRCVCLSVCVAWAMVEGKVRSGNKAVLRGRLPRYWAETHNLLLGLREVSDKKVRLHLKIKHNLFFFSFTISLLFPPLYPHCCSSFSLSPAQLLSIAFPKPLALF